MTDLLTLALVGAVVSMLVQWLKTYTLGGWRSQMVLVGVSLVGGGLTYFFQAHPSYWAEVVKVIVAANAVYSFVFRYFEKTQPTA